MQIFAAGILIALVLLVMPLLGVLLGAFVGAVIGFFFPETFYGFLDVIGLHSFEMWQFGAVLGFIGSFFRSNPNSGNNG